MLILNEGDCFGDIECEQSLSQCKFTLICTKNDSEVYYISRDDFLNKFARNVIENFKLNYNEKVEIYSERLAFLKESYTKFKLSGKKQYITNLMERVIYGLTNVIGGRKPNPPVKEITPDDLFYFRKISVKDRLLQKPIEKVSKTNIIRAFKAPNPTKTKQPNKKPLRSIIKFKLDKFYTKTLDFKSVNSSCPEIDFQPFPPGNDIVSFNQYKPQTKPITVEKRIGIYLKTLKKIPLKNLEKDFETKRSDRVTKNSSNPVILEKINTIHLNPNKPCEGIIYNKSDLTKEKFYLNRSNSQLQDNFIYEGSKIINKDFIMNNSQVNLDAFEDYIKIKQKLLFSKTISGIQFNINKSENVSEVEQKNPKRIYSKKVSSLININNNIQSNK